MCRCNTVVAFSLKTISVSMKAYSCRRSLRHVLVNLNVAEQRMTLAMDNSVLILALHADKKWLL